MSNPGFRGKLAMTGAAVLLVLGMTIDVGMNRPRATEIRRLSAQRSQLRVKAAQDAQQQAEFDFLVKHLGGKNAKESSTSGRIDPITFLGRAVDSARLKQLELSSETSLEVGDLVRNRMFLRAEGSYAGIVRLMRSLEMSQRIVTIDAFSIEPALTPGAVEGRLNVSVYDPKGSS